jgi:hypothetical protein
MVEVSRRLAGCGILQQKVCEHNTDPGGPRAGAVLPARRSDRSCSEQGVHLTLTHPCASILRCQPPAGCTKVMDGTDATAVANTAP